MLKSFVQLFAETFLKNKKSWISEQSSICPSDFQMVQITADGQERSFTMPFSGYAIIHGYGVAYAEVNKIFLVNGGLSANFNLAGGGFFKKGTVVTYNILQASNFTDAYIRLYKTTADS